MSVRVEHDGPTIAVVSVSGEVDMATVGDLMAAVSDAVASPRVTSLVIDLLDVSFMDSSGLGGIVSLRQRYPRVHVSLVVGEGMVSLLLRTTAVDRLFRLTSSVAEALEGGEPSSQRT